MIRAAVPADARGIAEVHVASWLGAYRGLMPDETLEALDVELRAERWRKALEESSEGALVAEEGGAIYGWATVGRSRDPDAGDDVGELYGLYLHPAHWGLGRGRQLHDAALDELRAQGFVEATLWVLESNARARGFYERQGWRTDGSVKSDRVGELRTLVDEVRYRRKLRWGQD